MRFLCDHMLGTLARWLRFLGYDTAYPEAMEDAALRELAVEEERILLTRDRELGNRVADAVLVESDDPDVQLTQIVRTFGLTDEAALSRCSVCNVTIQEASREDARGNVPDAVRDRHDEFWRCGTCGRFYWRGSHFDAVTAKVREVVGRAGGP